MKNEDVRHYNDQELNAKIKEYKATLHDLTFNHAITPIENPARIQKIRKDIARFYTILQERKNKV